MTSTIQLSKKFKNLLKKESEDGETYEDTIKRLINCISSEVLVFNEEPAFSLQGYYLAKDGGMSSAGSTIDHISYTELKKSQVGDSWNQGGDHYEEALVIFKDDKGAFVRFTTITDYSNSYLNIGVEEEVEVIYFNFL